MNRMKSHVLHVILMCIPYCVHIVVTIHIVFTCPHTIISYLISCAGSLRWAAFGVPQCAFNAFCFLREWSDTDELVLPFGSFTQIRYCSKRSMVFLFQEIDYSGLWEPLTHPKSSLGEG